MADPALTAPDFDFADFGQGMVDCATQADGRTDTLPAFAGCSSLHYNKELLAARNVEVPKTWDETADRGGPDRGRRERRLTGRRHPAPFYRVEARCSPREPPLNTSTILVTGASGTVGREVAKRLAERGAPARLALRDPARGIEGAEALERVRFDFHGPSGFDEALRGVDRVFLLRPPQLADARRDFDPFLGAMLEAEVKRVVFLSVRGAERNPLLPHHRIEKALERSGLAWTHLRPNDWMQNFATVHRDDIRTRGEIWAPAGKGRTSFVDARDVAEAAAEVLTGHGHERRAYALTGGEELDLDEVAAVLSHAIGRRVAYRNPGVVAFLRHVRAAGRPLSLGLVMTGVYTVARLGLAAGVSPELERLIGRPPTAFRSFAEDHAAVWR